MSGRDSSFEDKTQIVAGGGVDERLDNCIRTARPENFPGSTYLSPHERLLTFHGTTGHERAVNNFANGFVGQSETYCAHTYDMAISLSGRLGDGTVTVWDPPSENWLNPNNVNLSSRVPLSEGKEEIDDKKIARKNKSLSEKQETYIAPEYLEAIVSFTPEQATYIRDHRKVLLAVPGSVEQENFQDYVEDFIKNFPHPEQVIPEYRREGSTLNIGRLLEVAVIKTYESSLQKAGEGVMSPYRAETTEAEFQGFPTFGIEPYEKFKESCLKRAKEISRE